jgi:hypothetical protein
VIATYVAKADVENLEIQIGLKKPPQMALTMIDAYAKISETAALLINNWRTSSATGVDPQTGQPLMPSAKGDMYMNLLITLGLPRNVAQIFSAKGTGAIPGADQDYVTLMSSKDPEFSGLRPKLRVLAESLRRPDDERGYRRLEKFAVVS